jgi:hypothetical protein
MSERDAFEAQREAVRGLATRRERPFRHESAVQTYLAGVAYLESRPRPATASEEPAQPVDEPAPLAPAYGPRR